MRSSPSERSDTFGATSSHSFSRPGAKTISASTLATVTLRFGGPGSSIDRATRGSRTMFRYHAERSRGVIRIAEPV